MAIDTPQESLAAYSAAMRVQILPVPDGTVHSSDSGVWWNIYNFTGDLGESLHAQVTADIKERMEAINGGGVDYHTTIDTVTEMRSILDIDTDGTFLLLQEDPPEYMEDYQHTGDVVYKYTLIYIKLTDDSGSNEPFTYQNRNVVADITKSLMIDRTRGGVAINTEIEQSGHAIFVDENGNQLPGTFVLVNVNAMVNADNPYQLA